MYSFFVGFGWLVVFWVGFFSVWYSNHGAIKGKSLSIRTVQHSHMSERPFCTEPQGYVMHLEMCTLGASSLYRCLNLTSVCKNLPQMEVLE